VLAAIAAAIVATTALAASCGAPSDRDRSDVAAPPTSDSTQRPTGTAPAGSTQPEAAESSRCAGKLQGPRTHRYRYDVGDEAPDLVSLDVYRRPGAVACPVIIWVHGGGWQRGDKAGKAIQTKVDFAGELGAVLVSVNYRLANSEIRWPVMGQDVAAAVASVIEHADELGIDPSRVTLMGHSAGAHLVSIVATDPDLLAEAGASREDLRCVVSIDTAAYDLTDPGSPTEALITDAFGDDPATLAAASPAVQIREHPSGLPDFLLITRGGEARLAESQELADAISATGATAQVVKADGYSHEQVNTQLGVPGEQIVTPPTRAFLEACGITGS
jgi:acetyl esterase/lipase